MAYSDFTLQSTRDRFGIRLEERESLFPEAPSCLVSDFLRLALHRGMSLAFGNSSEKARSEGMVVPVLLELKAQMEDQINVFSGVQFCVDSGAGLDGFCDYLVSASTERYFVDAPVLAVVEAKREDLVVGLGQTLATMVAVERFNHDRGMASPQSVHGAVTSGTNWKFLRLRNGVCAIDPNEYLIQDPGRILGVLRAMLHDTGLVPAAADDTLLV